MSLVPDLIKVFRPGAGRQRLRKGYVIDLGSDEDSYKALLATGSRAQSKAAELGFALHGAQGAIWIDTGLVWLHNSDHRQRLASRLLAMVGELREAVEALGGRILPSAVRLDPNVPWDRLVCGDEHFFETSSERERTTFCNLLRYHLPGLIALTGRAGASPSGVEQFGSRRLAESQRHVTAYSFVSLHPKYLPHLMKSFAREGRVRHTSLLDIDPHAADAVTPDADGCVELRFVDAQVSVWTTVAHAMLFEALFIRARRLAAENKRVPGYAQPLFERDRTRAIQHGLQARFTRRSSEARLPARDGATPPADDDTEGADARLVPAAGRLLELIDDLTYEFQALDVRSHQVLPLVLGMKLRQWGHLGVQNENDLLQSVLAGTSSESVETRLSRLLLSSKDPLCEINGRFKAQMSNIRSAWDERLRVERTPVDDRLASTSDLARQRGPTLPDPGEGAPA